LMHFQTTRIKSLKIICFTSGVVKNVFWCILPHHQIQVLEKLFFDVWDGEKRVLMHFQTTRIKSLKNYFFHLWSG
jgi:hypothetical protein